MSSPLSPRDGPRCEHYDSRYRLDNIVQPSKGRYSSPTFHGHSRNGLHPSDAPGAVVAVFDLHPENYQPGFRERGASDSRMPEHRNDDRRRTPQESFQDGRTAMLVGVQQPASAHSIDVRIRLKSVILPIANSRS